MVARPTVEQRGLLATDRRCEIGEIHVRRIARVAIPRLIERQHALLNLNAELLHEASEVAHRIAELPDCFPISGQPLCNPPDWVGSNELFDKFADPR